MRRRTFTIGLILPAILVMLVEVRPIMSQPIGPRGAPLVSFPSFVGPAPAFGHGCAETGWSYYGLPSGPTTALTDYRVGVWNWGWSGSPPKGPVCRKLLSCYGPPVPSYLPAPAMGATDARRFFINPPGFGFGLNAFGYLSPFPRLATPSVSVIPTSTPVAASCCRVDVRLPRADAELWVNKTKTATAGAERTFETPELTDGREFRYEVEARWVRNGVAMTAARSVVVAGGRSVSVDFTQEK